MLLGGNQARQALLSKQDRPRTDPGQEHPARQPSEVCLCGAHKPWAQAKSIKLDILGLAAGARERWGPGRLPAP